MPPERSRYQEKIIKNYYRNRDAIGLQKAQEAVTELYLSEGKKRATVTNMLRLLNLADEVQDHLAKGDISMGHARALLALTSPEAQTAACLKVIREGLSVRQVEKLIEPKQPKTRKAAKSKDPHLSAIEDDLRRRLGTRVALRSSDGKRGKIEIEYYTLEDLERILAAIRE